LYDDYIQGISSGMWWRSLVEDRGCADSLMSGHGHFPPKDPVAAGLQSTITASYWALGLTRSMLSHLLTQLERSFGEFDLLLDMFYSGYAACAVKEWLVSKNAASRSSDRRLLR
jgi:hypothetical protein